MNIWSQLFTDSIGLLSRYHSNSPGTGVTITLCTPLLSCKIDPTGRQWLKKGADFLMKPAPFPLYSVKSKSSLMSSHIRIGVLANPLKTVADADV